MKILFPDIPLEDTQVVAKEKMYGEGFFHNSVEVYRSSSTVLH
jgi:hypothetical protein